VQHLSAYSLPVLVTLRHKASVRLIQTPSTVAVAMVAVHSQCLSVSLLESYRACLWCIVGGNISDPLMSVHTIWNKVMSSKLGQAGAALNCGALTTCQHHYSPN